MVEDRVLSLKGKYEVYQKNITSKLQFRKTEGILDVKHQMHVAPIWEKYSCFLNPE